MTVSVLVMDNARIHHGGGILELADRFRLSHLSFLFVRSMLTSLVKI